MRTIQSDASRRLYRSAGLGLHGKSRRQRPGGELTAFLIAHQQAKLDRAHFAPIALGTRDVPAGTFITLAIGAANRDPAEFPDPERLDIARRPNNHLAFGQGAHACSGMNVARMEGRIAIGKLFARYPGIELSAAPERDRRLRFRGFRRLPVRLG